MFSISKCASYLSSTIAAQINSERQLQAPKNVENKKVTNKNKQNKSKRKLVIYFSSKGY